MITIKNQPTAVARLKRETADVTQTQFTSLIRNTMDAPMKEFAGKLDAVLAETKEKTILCMKQLLIRKDYEDFSEEELQAFTKDPKKLQKAMASWFGKEIKNDEQAAFSRIFDRALLKFIK